MKKNILPLVIVLAAGGVWLAATQNNPANKTGGQSMEKPESLSTASSATEPKLSMEEKKPTNSGSVKPAAASEYQDYSPAAVNAAQDKGQTVVLFFYAPWCPYCKAADAAFKASTSQIPLGVTVLKTDYDSNTELKKKYGVTYQHTFVQIDTNGNLVTKWVSGDLDLLRKSIK